jgi:hypothetical protein
MRNYPNFFHTVPHQNKNTGPLKRIVQRYKRLFIKEERYFFGTIDGLLRYGNGDCSWSTMKDSLYCSDYFALIIFDLF